MNRPCVRSCATPRNFASAPPGLQQRAEIAQIGEGRDARADPAHRLALGFEQRLPEFLQGSPAEQAAHEQPVGPERPLDLDERARQVVDPTGRKLN